MNVTEATSTAAKLPLTFACGLYDRMLRLYTGEVQPRGVDLKFLANDEPRDIFDRMGGKLEFDASEMSSSEFISRFGTGHCPFVAIPRLFRHGFIFFNRKAGIRTPKDLEGKRVGVPLYTMSAAILDPRPAAARMWRRPFENPLGARRTQETGRARQSDGGAATQATGNRDQPFGRLPQQAPSRRRNRCLHQLPPGRGDRIEPRYRALVSQLPRGGEGLLPAHPHLSDHASHRHPPRCPRGASVRGAEPLRRVVRVERPRARADEGARRAALHAALASRRQG